MTEIGTSRKRSNSSEQRSYNMNTTTGCKQRRGPGLVPALGSLHVQSSPGEPAQPAISDPSGDQDGGIHAAPDKCMCNRNLQQEARRPARLTTRSSQGINKRVSGSYTRSHLQWLSGDSKFISTRSINEPDSHSFNQRSRRRANPSGTSVSGLAGY